MDKKIRVTGNSRARTALGIAHALMAIRPDVRVQALNQFLPLEVCPDCGLKELPSHKYNGSKTLFLPATVAEKLNTPDRILYFTAPIELLIMGNKTPVALVAQWSSESYARLLERMKNIPAVEIAEIEETIDDPLGFKLEFLDGYQPPKAKGCLGLPLLFAFVAILAGVIRLI